MRHYTITSKEAGLRLDRYIAEVKPDFTRNFIQKLIKDGHVFIDNKKVTKTAYKLKEDEELIFMIPSIKDIGIDAEDIPLDILYEDDDMLAVNKPPFMVVHPTDHGAHVAGTLVNAIMHHCKNLSGIGGEKRPGIVHRLDKETSGAILVAKNDKAHSYLAKQFENREIKKVYIALLKGHLRPKEGSIEAPLKRTYGGQDVHVSASKEAKYALTHYNVREYIGDYTLVEVRIVTGRTHQIRVHFASIGHPVIGDSMYGNAKENLRAKELGLKRQFLHAHELTFKVPSTEKSKKIKAPLPDDLEEVLKNLE